MNTTQDIPISLKVVAGLFILSGIMAAIEIATALYHDHVSINLGVLGLFIGRGLLRQSMRWRWWALFFIWSTIILSTILMPLVLFASEPIDYKIGGHPAGQIDPNLIVGCLTAFIAAAVWQFRVLNRADVLKLFGIQKG